MGAGCRRGLPDASPNVSLDVPELGDSKLGFSIILAGERIRRFREQHTTIVKFQVVRARYRDEDLAEGDGLASVEECYGG